MIWITVGPVLSEVSWIVMSSMANDGVKIDFYKLYADAWTFDDSSAYS